MVDDRRSARRAALSGVRVTYESATMDQVEADALNLGSGGLFILTEAPLPVGKRLAIELNVEGESETWSALGRVVWTRGAATSAEPSGMGVKLIDMEDGVIEAIDRLVEARAVDAAPPGAAKVEPVTQPPPPPAPPAPAVERPKEPVPGAMAIGAPAREKTLMGVGLAPIVPEMPAPPPSQRPAAPVPAKSQPAPSSKANAREPSVVIDLVPDNERAAGKRNEQTVTSVVPSTSRQKGKAGWIVILMLIVAAAAIYALWDGDLDRALKTFGLTTSEAPAVASVPPPPPLPAVGVTATRSAAPAFTTAITAASASGYARPGPAMTGGAPASSARASSGAGPASSSARSPNAGGAASRKGNEDNPY